MSSPKIAPFRLFGRSVAESIGVAPRILPLALLCFAAPALLLGRLHDGELARQRPEIALALLVLVRFVGFQVLVGVSTAVLAREPRGDAATSSVSVAFRSLGHMFVFCFLPNIGLRVVGSLLEGIGSSWIPLVIELLRFGVALVAYARVSVAAVALVLERMPARSGIDRAVGLTEGQLGRISLLFLPIVFVDQLVFDLLLTADLSGLAIVGIALISSAVLATLGAVATQGLFRELREGQEGKPKEELAEVFS